MPAAATNRRENSWSAPCARGRAVNSLGFRAPRGSPGDARYRTYRPESLERGNEALALTWVRTHDWDAEAWRDAFGLPRHRPRPLLPDRHHRPRARPDRGRPRDLRRVPGQRRVPRVRPRHQPGGRASGAAPPKRSAASCARPGWPSSAWSASRPGSRRRHVRSASSVDVAAVLRAGPCRCTRVPSSLCISIDAAELAGHQRLHDRQAEAAATARAMNPSGRPTPSSTHLDEQLTVVARELHVDRAGRCAPSSRERVVDRVLHQLVEHDRERRRDLARQLAGVALDLEAQIACSGDDDGLLDQPRERPHDLVEARRRRPRSRDSVSCTIAIERIRRSDSSSAACASGDCSRRPWSRSSDAIVCRLFFTRWWISRIVASFESSMRSRRRRSVTSRSSTSAPVELVVRRAAGCTRTSTDDVVALDLLGDRQARRATRGVDRVLVEADLGEVQRPTCTRGCPCGAASSPRSGSRTSPASRRRARSRRRRRAARSRSRSRRRRTGTCPSAIMRAKRSNVSK